MLRISLKGGLLLATNFIRASLPRKDHYRPNLRSTVSPADVGEYCDEDAGLVSSVSSLISSWFRHSEFHSEMFRFFAKASLIPSQAQFTCTVNTRHRTRDNSANACNLYDMYRERCDLK